jgi:ArsR family transcriptional regulator, nickel/cobalt-responsive transcriptional repressor
MGKAHGVTSATPITAEGANRVARVMSALATASRVRILARLRQAPCAVTELAATVEMAQPAVSHQLRILRDLGLVVGIRDGRNTVYALHDLHVATLLDEALRHIAHLPTKEHAMPHTHDEPHAHEHDHDGTTHVHAHTEHDHEHVEHTHDHAHDGADHSHTHTHAAGHESDHEHAHA